VKRFTKTLENFIGLQSTAKSASKLALIQKHER